MYSEIVKNCKKHGELNLSQVLKELSRAKHEIYRCKQCKLEKDRRYAASHRKELCEKNKIYKKNNREKINLWSREDRKKKPELYAEQSKRNREKLGSFRNVMEISRIRGISTDQYQSMLVEQDYKCAICNLPETKKSRSGKTTQLSLDHNHDTKKVRGFLCHACNLMLGQFKESEEIIISSINYLKKHGELCQ